MKKLIAILTLFISLSLYAETLDWKSEIMTGQLGSCATNDLSFKALRFYKIPLKQFGDNFFLRVLLFLKNDTSVSIRLTVQELISCSNSRSGEEVCSYRPVENAWIKSNWSEHSDLIVVNGLGLMSFDADTSKIVMQFDESFQYKEIAARSFKGSMVRVNFDDQGRFSHTLCQKP